MSKKESSQKTNKPTKTNKNNDISLSEFAMNNMIKKRKRTNVIALSLLLLLIVFTILSTLFALLNLNSENILKNTYIAKTSVSNLSQKDAIDLLHTKYNEFADKAISIKHQDYVREIAPNDIDFQILSEKSVMNAYNLGRSTNIFSNNFAIISSFFKKNNFDLEYTYDRDLLNQMTKDIEINLPGKLVENSHKINKDKLAIYKGKDGVVLDKDKLANELMKAFINLDSDRVITMPVKSSTPEPLDIEKIQKDIYKKTADATYDSKTKKITNEVKGVDLAITIAEAKKILAENKEKYTIPLKITTPKVTAKMLSDKYFKPTYNDLLAKETTHYDATNVDRSINLEISSKAINGFVLKPGHKFSFNSFVGRTSPYDGYKQAIGYAGGKAVPMWGGGVCQISSGIYAAALRADLLITERFNHGCPVSYMPPGLDAATDLGSCDLRFINDRTYPIKILVNTANGVSTVQIMGTKEANEPVIKLTSTKINTVPYRTSYVNDYSLKPGQEKIEIKGLTGFTSKLYKEKYVNGVLLSKTLISTDTYKPLHEVIKRRP